MDRDNRSVGRFVGSGQSQLGVGRTDVLGLEEYKRSASMGSFRGRICDDCAGGDRIIGTQVTRIVGACTIRREKQSPEGLCLLIRRERLEPS